MSGIGARLGRWAASLRTLVRETLALRARSGPYRFLVKRWHDLGDLDLMAAVIDTDFFTGDLAPVPLPLGEMRRLLVIAPHQDDETIGAGGTMVLAREAGVQVDILFMTDGAQRSVGYAADEATSVAVRDAEAHAVCDRLGATKRDFGLSNLAPRPTRGDVDRLAGIIRERRPDAILTPWLLDRPAKHRLVNHLLAFAAERHDLGAAEIWGYAVHSSPYPNAYVDITAAADEKRRLLALYPSQNEHCQRWDHLAMAASAWHSRWLGDAPVARFVEPFHTLPLDVFADTVRRLYERDLARTYHGHGPVLAAARGLVDAA